MTINEDEIVHYRTNVIKQYIIPVMEKYHKEEITYIQEVKRINKLLKGVKDV